MNQDNVNTLVREWLKIENELRELYAGLSDDTADRIIELVERIDAIRRELAAELIIGDAK